MRVGVIVFPGTNCDADTYHVLDHVYQAPVEYIWHASTQLPPVDALILPGGFSYGDYLRAGAIARFSPVMTEVARFADAGGLVLGICNGFQILCEAGLLPGALLPNGCLQFRCVWTHVRVEDTDTPFTNQATPGQVLQMPIAHGEGRYFADPATLARLAERRQIVLRYCAPDGSLDPASNPNGSLDAIAGICNERRKVFGLMPHPERCSEAELGGTDGQVIFRSLLTALSEAMTSAALQGGETGPALQGDLTGSALKGGSRDEGTEVPGASVPASLILAFKPETSPLAPQPEILLPRGHP